MGCASVKFAADTNLGGPFNTPKLLSEGLRQARERGQQKLHEIQQGQAQSCATGKEKPLNDTAKAAQAQQMATMMVKAWSISPPWKG